MFVKYVMTWSSNLPQLLPSYVTQASLLSSLGPVSRGMVRIPLIHGWFKLSPEMVSISF